MVAKRYFYLPKFTIMHKTTSIEVKCECTIPFHQELVGFLLSLVDKSDEAPLPKDVPHREAICQAIQQKMLFIKIIRGRPAGKWRRRITAKLQDILNKKLVGTIKVDDAITLVLV